MDPMYPAHASSQACGLMTALTSDQYIATMSVENRIALMQACALLSIAHEIAELTKAANQIAHGTSALAKATTLLAEATSKHTEKTIHVMSHPGR